MSTSPAEASAATVRKPLAERLVADGLAIVAESGPESLSLREVQRRAGVSPAAAYRHFRDRDDLLAAIAGEAGARLADHLAAAMAEAPEGGGELETARARLLASSRAYVRFAEQNPGLYRAIFVDTDRGDDLDRPAPAGQGGYGLLVDAVSRLVAAAGGETDRWDPLVIWSACHGLAMLRLHAALRALPDDAFAAARDHVLETVIAGVPQPRG